MDCRGAVGIGLCLLIGAGCQHQVTMLSPASSASLSVSQKQPLPVGAKIGKASSQPSKELPPAVLVSWGDFKAGEALAPDISPSRQQEIRDAARADYEQALKADPKNIPAYQGLARLCTSMHNHDRAIETYQSALKIAPNNAALWYELGMSHNYQKNWQPALDCLGRAAQLEPANRYYNNALGIVLAEAGHYNESLNCFVRANGQAMGNMRLAQTLQHLHQPALSRQFMNAALEKDPKLAMTLQGGDDAAQPAPVQRTSFQAANIPLAPVEPAEQPQAQTPTPVPEPEPSPMPEPGEIQPQTTETEAQTSPQPILIPSPPPINSPDADPAPTP